MRTPKWVVLFCVLSLLSLSIEPLQAYGASPFSGLEVSNSLNPAGAKVFGIKENSPALQSDLRINDVITSIEGHAVNSIDDFVRVSQGLKDKESVSISVYRWGVVVEIRLGKKPVVEQAKPETRVQAEPPPRQAEVKTVQKGFENPVVPDATGVTYRHGQYPSEGNNTHPGIDITAECGSLIYAFADGKVAELIKDEKDPHFKFLGYMVIVKHLEPINGKDTYSLYLHMKEPPAVSKGQTVKAGDVIGKVGDTGNAKGCHVHFELRHFPDRFLNDKGWNYPLNIYGKGDQRNEKRFLENWENPEVYFGKYPGGMVSQTVKPQPETKKVVKGDDTAKRGGSLEALFITPIDLPEGYELIEEEYIDNRPVAEADVNGLLELESWGRVNGYIKTFEFKRGVYPLPWREPGEPGEPKRIVNLEVTEYKTAKGATKAFQWFKEIFQSEETVRKGTEAFDVKLLKFKIRKNLKYGDESFMVYINGTAPDPPILVTFEKWQAVCRNNEILIVILWEAVNTSIFESEVIQLLEKMTGRIK